MEEKKISIQGLDVSYKIGGSGRPFLILHGWGSRAEKWEKTAEILMGKGLKVVVPDLPGFGGSQKPVRAWGIDDYCDFVDDFAKSLNLEKFYLLGHSFGGALAIKYSLKFPQKVPKLFLAASACARKKTLEKEIIFGFSKFFKIFSFLPFYPYFRKGFYKFIVRKSDYNRAEGVMKESYLKIIKEDLSDKLSSITSPTIIIWGDKDKITPKEEAYFIKEKINNSKIIFIPGGEHDLERKTPDILAKEILNNI